MWTVATSWEFWETRVRKSVGDRMSDENTKYTQRMYCFV